MISVSQNSVLLFFHVGFQFQLAHELFIFHSCLNFAKKNFDNPFNHMLYCDIIFDKIESICSRK